MRRKRGMARRAIRRSPVTKTGTTTTNIKAKGPPITKAMTMEKIIIKGARTAVRMIIINAICTLPTSVVSRVTRLDVEKWSMLEKEKSCTR